MCVKNNDRITGRRNFSDKWIVGADCVKTSNIRDQSDQHVHAMNLEKKEWAQENGLVTAQYAPQALYTLPEEERDRLSKKFDIAYFVATEHLAFRKYEKLCELEIRHGVELGVSCQHRNACKEFIHYIAESIKENVVKAVLSAGFFSLF